LLQRVVSYNLNSPLFIVMFDNPKVATKFSTSADTYGDLRRVTGELAGRKNVLNNLSLSLLFEITKTNIIG